MSPYQVEPRAEVKDDLLLLEATKLWDHVEALDRAPSMDAAAQLLVAVQEARAALAVAEEDLARFLWDVAPRGESFIVGTDHYQLRGGSKRTAWDHDDVRRDLQKAISAKLERDPKDVEEVVGAWTMACGFQWKTTGLRVFGLDPDEYCHSSLGPPRFSKA